MSSKRELDGLASIVEAAESDPDGMKLAAAGSLLEGGVMTDIGLYAIQVADLLDIPRSEARKHIAQRTCGECGARPFWPSKHHVAVVSHRPGCSAVTDAVAAARQGTDPGGKH